MIFLLFQFIINDKLDDNVGQFKRKKTRDGSYTYEKTGENGKKIVLSVPGTPIPPVKVEKSK